MSLDDHQSSSDTVPGTPVLSDSPEVPQIRLSAAAFGVGFVLLVLTAGMTLWALWQMSVLDQQLKLQQERFMSSVINERRDALINWLGKIADDVALMATFPAMKDILIDFKTTRGGLNYTDFARYIRLTHGLEEGSKKEKTTAAKILRERGYTTLHDRFQPWFKEQNLVHGYYDFFLFDESGFLIYSVEKEDDYGTSLRQGPWSSSGLGEVVRHVLQADASTDVSFSDYSFYGPSAGAAASFLASAMRDDAGEIIGVVAVQMPRDRLNAIMNKRPGELAGGRFYLTGNDGYLRSDMIDEETLLKRRGISPFSTTQITEETVTILPPRRGVKGDRVIAAARIFRIRGVEFTIVGEFEVDNLTMWQGKQRSTLYVLLLSSAILVTVSLFMLWIRRQNRRQPE